MEEIVELAMEASVAHLPASPNKLQEYQEAQNVNLLCSIAIKYCREGWPKNRPDEALAPYWEARGSLTLQGNLLLLGNRIVVPASMQQTTLTKLHQGH